MGRESLSDNSEGIPCLQTLFPNRLEKAVPSVLPPTGGVLPFKNLFLSLLSVATLG